MSANVTVDAAAAVEATASPYNWTKEESELWWWHDMTEEIEHLTQQCRQLRLDHQFHIDQKNTTIKALEQKIKEQEEQINGMASVICRSSSDL